MGAYLIRLLFDRSEKQRELIKIQKELMALYEAQMTDLSMMSKIELGDDVIAEIKRLESEILKYEGSLKNNTEDEKK